MDTIAIREQVVNFIESNYLFGDSSRMPDDEDSLLESRVLDSTGVLELIEFLESDFEVRVDDADTTPDNLGSVGNIVRFVQGRAA